jgi:hypothetical protein
MANVDIRDLSGQTTCASATDNPFDGLIGRTNNDPV